MEGTIDTSPSIESIIRKTYPVVGALERILTEVVDETCRGAAWKDVRKEGFPHPTLE